MWGVDWDSLPDVIRNRVPKHAKETSNYFPDQFSGLPANGYSAFIKDMFSGVDVLLGVDKDAWQQIKAKKVIYCGRPDQIRLKQNMRVGDVGNRWLEYRSLKITLKLEKWTNKSTVVNFCHYKNNFTRKSCLQSAYMPQHSSDTIVTYEQPVGVDNNDPTPFYYFPTEYNDTKNSLINDIIKEEYPNIIMAGRLGTSKYIDMDAAVAMGIDISNKLK
jgi:UDP-galactopyranose mutase